MHHVEYGMCTAFYKFYLLGRIGREVIKAMNILTETIRVTNYNASRRIWYVHRLLQVLFAWKDRSRSHKGNEYLNRNYWCYELQCITSNRVCAPPFTSFICLEG